MSSSSSKTKPFSRSAGDWTCPDNSCGNLNFARRDQCNRCDAAKPNGSASGSASGSSGSRDRDRDRERDQEDSDEKKYNAIGNAAAKSSRGLFSPEDWSCMKCGNINWARRSTCNICNAKKFADEERTGYGGGYNERSNVEYKDPVSSDSEYDEFGRRKKKKNNRQTSEGSRKTVSTKTSRETRRSRSRSRSRSSSSSSSSTERNHRRKRSRKSPSPKRDRRRRRSPSSSSSSDSSRERSSRKHNKVPDENRSKREPPLKEKSPQRNVVAEDDDEEESGSDEDLSKYNLFDDDFDIENFKKDGKDSS